ncbi:SpoIIE family protein phosphatase [Streptomyces sp. NPDC020681]|uniref:SpoIIE family protein phosphatase n=1 Tax=Streptomyces sp. NPDC020681 TaxID=3365083 RepID=UPI00378E74FE
MSDADVPSHGGLTTAGMPTALLETLFTHARSTLLVLDTNLQVVRANTPSDGAVAQDVPGRSLTEVYRIDEPDGVEETLRAVLRTGVPTRERPFRGSLADDPGPDHSLTLSCYRLDDPGGSTLGLLAAVVDVTEHEKARNREAALTAVRETVGRTLDVAATCRELAEALVPGFADIAVVEVVDYVLRGADPPLGPLGRGVPLRRAAFQGPGADANQAHPVGDVRDLPYPSPYALALSDLQPRLVALGTDTPWLAADPSRARAIEASGAHSLIVAPLTLRGTVLGLISLYRCGKSDPYDESDVTLVLTAAAQTALSIDNARCYARDHTIASTVQRHLLPQHDSARLGLETAHLHLPGANSGCWFDTFALSGERTALVVGNVAGVGIETAAAMGQLRTVIHALAALDLEPDELLARLNDTATRLARERAALPTGDLMHRQPLTATCTYGVYDPFSRTCTVARAGHAVPLVVHPDGSTAIPDVPEGPHLSSDDTAPFPSVTLTLDEGSLLAFCTGGFLRDGETISDPVRDTLAHPGRRLQDLCDAAAYTLSTAPGPDGAALLLARVGTVPQDHVATLELGNEPTSPAIARSFARDRLTAWDLSAETVFAAELIVSELVTNAVRYGAPPVSLRLVLGHALTCEVHDSSAAAPHLRHARTVDEGGRGLFIVSQLAAQWGTRYAGDGKTLWTEQPLDPTG